MKKYLIKINIVFIFLALIAVPQGISNAQQQPDISEEILLNAQNDSLIPSVELNASSSGVLGDTVNISTYTSNIDTSTAEFLWYIDDVFIGSKSGKGKTDFDFVTSRENHVVRLTIMNKNERITENAIFVSSYNVSMTWSTDTYTPPGYEGKALPSRKSRVTVTAIPEIAGYDSDELLYTWYLDGSSRVRGVVGRDDFSFPITGSIDEISVFVEVSNPARSITVTQAVIIPVVRPSVLIYSKKSERQAETAISRISVSPGDLKNLIAKPFNFRARNMIDFDYIWEFMGVRKMGERGYPNLLTLSIPENSGYGKRYLKLETANRNIASERATIELTIEITKNK